MAGIKPLLTGLSYDVIVLYRAIILSTRFVPFYLLSLYFFGGIMFRKVADVAAYAAQNGKHNTRCPRYTYTILCGLRLVV